MRKKIHTVLGEIEPDELGFTQCHEHLMLSKGQSYQCNPALCIDDVDASVREVLDYRANGGRALVEAQPVGCNRMSEELREISKRTGVSVVASTGFHKMQFYQEGHWIRTVATNKAADLFIKELIEGMYIGTDVYSPFKEEHAERIRQEESRAGIIKTALDVCDLTEPYKRLFCAAAEAQRVTGAPMMVHIEKGSNPLQLIAFLQKQNVAMERLYFCHMDRACEQPEVFKAVLQAGVTLEFDTIGRFQYHSDEKELEWIKLILENGHEDQLLFSLDTTRERLKAYVPEAVGLTYIQKNFLPKMRAAGITENQIEKISVSNPKRILAW